MRRREHAGRATSGRLTPRTARLRSRSAPAIFSENAKERFGLSALHPEDNQALIYDGLDFALVLYRVEREFKVTIPLTVLKSETAIPAEIDGTFDSVVCYLDKVKRDEQRS